MAPAPWLRRLASAPIVAVIVGTTAGCAPGTPDGDSWRIDAQRAVSDASSAVQTAELALRQNARGRVFDRYLQTVLVEAEEGVGKASDAIASKQPPRAERERYDAVTGQLDEAAGLVSTARIAGRTWGHGWSAWWSGGCTGTRSTSTWRTSPSWTGTPG